MKDAGWLRRSSPRALLLGMIIGLGLALGGCQRPLPEAQSVEAQLYLRRCGQCHMPYHPNSLTAAMWDRQVTAMEGKIRQAHLPELSSEERDAIVAYLTRNAGSR